MFLIPAFVLYNRGADVVRWTPLSFRKLTIHGLPEISNKQTLNNSNKRSILSSPKLDNLLQKVSEIPASSATLKDVFHFIEELIGEDSSVPLFVPHLPLTNK